MATNVSHGFNIPKHDWTATLKRSFTLGRRLKNAFTPNFENHLSTDKVQLLCKTATFGRFQKKEGDPRRVTFHTNLTTPEKTNGELLEVTSGHHLTALEEAKQRFTCPEPEDFSAERNLLLQVVSSKAQNKINTKIQQAKNSFQSGFYEDAKKRFKKINQSKSSKQEKTTVGLYLATIYLLQDNIQKAAEWLGEKPKSVEETGLFISLEWDVSLTQAMYTHINYLISKKRAKGPCLIPLVYEQAKNLSEDEKIMAKALCKKFVSK